MAGSSRSRRQRTRTKHYSDDDPSTFTTKVKKGAAHDTLSSPAEKGRDHAMGLVRGRGRGRGRGQGHTEPQPISASAVKKRPRHQKETCVDSLPSPPYTCIDHYVRIAPIFHYVEPPHSVIHGRGLGIPQPLKPPSWRLLPQSDAPSLVSCGTESTADGTCMVTSRRSTSLFTTMAANDTYLALGDTGGVVSIFALNPKFIVVTRLTTSASIREALEGDALPPSKKFGSYLKKTHPNQIEKIAIATLSHSDDKPAHRIVVSTKQEVELLDVFVNAILWTYSLDMSVHSLDIHPRTHQVLCSFSPDVKSESHQNQTQQQSSPNSAPLWLIDTVNESLCQTMVQPRVNEDELLPLGNRCSAIWDKSSPNCLIMVTLVSRSDDVLEQDLLQLDRSTFKILQRIVIPNKPSGKASSNTIESLSQSPSGHLTLVSSTKGIQLVQTETFRILRVFGEAVALHGHSLMFQQACFVPKPKSLLPLIDSTKKLEPGSQESPLDDAWILGVPFANREPREFCDVLHLWNLWDGKQVVTTLAGPPKTGGFISVECLPTQLIITTQTGQLFRMAPIVKSDFGGIMYPPGYQIINENLEYIEDEDEVDVVVSCEINELETDDEEEKETLADDDVAEALRLSLLELSSPKDGNSSDVDEVIDVVSSTESKQAFLPCRPDSTLKQQLITGSSPVSTASQPCIAPSESFIDSLLLPLPQLMEALEAKLDSPQSDETKALPKLVRAKRTKAASLEALLKSSLDMDLRRVMIARQNWSDGSGSHLGSVTKPSQEAKIEISSRDVFSKPSKNHTPTNEVHPSEVSLSEGSIKSDLRNIIDGPIKHDTDKTKMDVAAVLLMSANGELSIPAQSELHCSSGVHQGFDDDGGVHGGCLEAKIENVSLPPQCLACRGRFVYHICAKKEKPVDYEELARADEARKEKEEEEKRKVKTEKRRLADAKRREARKKKKMEEELKNRREELEKHRLEMEIRPQEIEGSLVHSDDKDRRRADMLLRLQAEQASNSGWSPPVQSHRKQSPIAYPSYQQSYGTESEWPSPSATRSTGRSSAFTKDWPPISSQDIAEDIPASSVHHGVESGETTNAYDTTASTNSNASFNGAEGWPPVVSKGLLDGSEVVRGSHDKKTDILAAHGTIGRHEISDCNSKNSTSANERAESVDSCFGTSDNSSHDLHLLSRTRPDGSMSGNGLSQNPSNERSEMNEATQTNSATAFNQLSSTGVTNESSSRRHEQSYSPKFFMETTPLVVSSAQTSTVTGFCGVVPTTDESVPSSENSQRSIQGYSLKVIDGYCGSPHASGYSSTVSLAVHDGDRQCDTPYHDSTVQVSGGSSSNFFSRRVDEDKTHDGSMGLYTASFNNNASMTNSGHDYDDDPSPHYYASKATPEMLVPAEALASLAMFATSAVPLASGNGSFMEEEQGTYCGQSQNHTRHDRNVYEGGRHLN